METNDVEIKEVETKESKPKKIKLSERITVYATGKKVSKDKERAFLKAGKPIKIHPVLAAKFIEKGFATKEPKK